MPARRRSSAFPALVPAAALLGVPQLFAGVYTSYNGGSGPDTPIPVGSIVRWATEISAYQPAPGVGPSFRNPAATSGFISLGDLYSTATPPAVGSEPSSYHAGAAVNDPYAGDPASTTDTYGFIGIDAPGSITFHYAQGIYNGVGADLAVRENGFGSGAGFFAELAFVEVSTNGSDFVRFPSLSTNTSPTSTVGQFQYYDMTNVYNLAGKHASNLATPFNLDDLAADPLVVAGTVDLNAIFYVRLVDVVGNPESSGPAGALDSQGNRILDNWVTYDSGGFDVNAAGAVGVLNAITAVPEPSSLLLLGLAASGLVFRRRA